MKTVIGIIGTIASGKDTAGAYIAKKLKAPIFEMSQPIIEEAKKRGVELRRENLAKISSEISIKKGDDYFIKQILEKIDDVGIITGMRQLPQLAFLRKRSNLILISIDADPRERFRRAIARHRLSEEQTFDSFVNEEKDENSGHHMLRLFECLKRADYKITSDNGIRRLNADLNEILKKESLIK